MSRAREVRFGPFWEEWRAARHFDSLLSGVTRTLPREPEYLVKPEDVKSSHWLGAIGLFTLGVAVLQVVIERQLPWAVVVPGIACIWKAWIHPVAGASADRWFDGVAALVVTTGLVLVLARRIPWSIPL